jgi:hypothetical protein
MLQVVLQKFHRLTIHTQDWHKTRPSDSPLTSEMNKNTEISDGIYWNWKASTVEVLVCLTHWVAALSPWQVKLSGVRVTW